MNFVLCTELAQRIIIWGSFVVIEGQIINASSLHPLNALGFDRTMECRKLG